MSDNKVATVRIDVSVAGYELGAQEAVISLGVNAIPEVSISCAPTVQEKLDPSIPNVQGPTIADYAKMYKDLSEKAESLNQTGNVKISIGADDEQSLSLEGWILSGVGLSGIGATQAPTMHVILQHPICRLTKVGSIYETSKSDGWTSLDSYTEKGKHFLDIVRIAHDFIAKRDEMFYPSAKGYDMPKAFRKMLADKEYMPDTYLSWKAGNTLFLAGKDGKTGPIAKAIGQNVFKATSGTSTWDMIVGFAGQLLLSIVQDKDDNYTTGKLVLEPTMPWKTASIRIDESRCSMTEVPGMDPFRLIGVCAGKLGAFSGPIDQGFYKQLGSDVAPVGEVLYAPVKDVSLSGGRIMRVAPPAFIEGAFEKDAQSGANLAATKSADGKDWKNGYNGAIGRYAQAIYETSARSMVGAKATMAVTFRDEDGSLIVPGQTCKFTAGGTPIYFGYIRQVVHYLSTDGGNSTSVAMSYVRPEESYKIGNQVAIAAGSQNAAYIKGA